MKQALRSALLIMILPCALHAQTVQPATAHEGLERLFARHFGGPGDATIDYLGQLLADLVEMSPFGTAPHDRAQTAGRTRAATIGVAYEALRFRTFEGFDLDNGEVSSFSGGLARVPITYVTRAKVSADVSTVFAVVAVSPRIDVSVGVPVVRVQVSGELQAIEDRGAPSEELAAPTLRVVPSSFTSVGDVTTGVKWHFWGHEGVQISGLGEVRWPTGERDNLTTAGNVVPKAGLVASLAASDAFRLNTMLSFAKGRGGAQLSQFTAPPFSGPIVSRVASLNQWAYGVGVEQAVHPRVTIGGNVLFRTLLDAVRYDRGNVRSASAIQAQSRFIPGRGALNIGSAGFGVTFDVSRSAVATVTVIIPITRDTGLQPGLTPTLGFQLGL